MKRALISSAVGIGGTGAGITGCYAMGVFDGSAEEKPSYEHFDGVKGYEKWGVYDDIPNFKKQVAPDCVTSIFSGITKINEAPGYQGSNPTENDAGFTFDSSKDSDGCVVIDWTREGKEKSNYTGGITFMWAFKQEGKGFISYVSLDFEKYGKEKAVLSSLIYALSKKEGGNEAWTITSQYELTSDKNTEIDKSKLPKPGSALKELPNKEFWGMEMEDTGTDLVNKNDLGGGTHDEYGGGSYWKWKGKNGNTKLNDWSSNLSDWWKEAFKSSINSALPDKMEGITGNWEKVIIQPGLKLEKTTG